MAIGLSASAIELQHRCTLPLMLTYALRRGYFALIGVLLFTLPIFLLVRDWTSSDLCSLNADCPPMTSIFLHTPKHHGWSDLVWQRGFPPYDYWPLGLTLLAGGIALQAFVMLRSRNR